MSRDYNTFISLDITRHTSHFRGCYWVVVNFYRVVRGVLQRWNLGITGVIMDVTDLLEGCNRGVTGVVQGWYIGVSGVLLLQLVNMCDPLTHSVTDWPIYRQMQSRTNM